MDDRRRILNSRVRWCQRLQTQSSSQAEKDGWLAEEAGLRDALLGRDRSGLIRTCQPSQLSRYELGFEDGQALLCHRSLKPLAYCS